jgi:hypothetical protein
VEPKPLGRGLEQVSRVFLSEPAPETRPPEREGSFARPLILHPASKISRQPVEDVLQEHPGTIEEGLRILDRCIPCAPCGEIDFLAVDRMTQLAVIDLEVAPSDELLIRGLAHFDWIVGNVPNMRRMYRGQTINFSLQPRLLLLAPEFSSRMRCAARQVVSPEVDCIRFHVVEAGGQPGVLFERLPAMD